MFSKRAGDLNTRRFWGWFASESQGLANSIEALARGEADAEWALIGLNDRIHRYDASLEADVFRDLDGRCRMVVSGGMAGSVDALITAAPISRSWIFEAGSLATAARRVQFRSAPRPSTDASPISGRHEAYA